MATTGSPTTTSSELPSVRGDQAGLLDLEDGDVAGRVAAHDARSRAAAVGEDRADLGAVDAVGAGDDVVVGDDVAVLALDDDAGTGGAGLAHAHLDRDDGGRHPLGDVGHGARARG